MQAEADDTWKDASLLDIANYKNGLAMQKFRPQPGDKGLPVLKIRELGQGECGPDAERCSSDIEDSVHVRDGDLIFSWSGTLMLDFWAGGDAGLNQHLFKMTSDKYPSWFYYMWTKHHMRKFIAMAKDRATTMGHIKRSALANAAVKIPPSDVLRSQTKAMQPLVDEVVGLKIQSRKLANLRDALLPKLMSGEIDVSKVEVPTPPNSHLYLSGNPTTEVEHGLVKKAVRAPVVVHLGMFVQESIDPSLEVVQELPQVEVDFEKAIGFQIPLHLLDAVAAGRHLVEDPELYDIEGRLVPFNMRCIDALVKIHTAQLIAVVARKVAGKTWSWPDIGSPYIPGIRFVRSRPHI